MGGSWTVSGEKTGWPGSLDCLDVDEDGRQEVLVQYLVGAHGCELKILGRRSGRFEEIARLNSGTPAEFELGDFDGEGRLEIKTEETNWSTSLPFVSAPRMN